MGLMENWGEALPESPNTGGTMSACKEDIQRPLRTHDDIVVHRCQVGGDYKFNGTRAEGELGSKWIVLREMSTGRW